MHALSGESRFQSFLLQRETTLKAPSSSSVDFALTTALGMPALRQAVDRRASRIQIVPLPLSMPVEVP